MCRFLLLAIAVVWVLAHAHVASAVLLPEEADAASAFKGWVTSSLVINGLEKNLASELGKGLALSGQRKLIRTRRPIFYPRILEEDIRRTKLFLARRGYPYAVVRTRFEPNREKKKVAVTLEIAPGPPVVIESLRLEGFPPELIKQAHSHVRLAPRPVFSEPDYEELSHSLESMLKHAGYARAELERHVDKRDSIRTSIRIVAHPGSVYHFENVVAQGVSEDLAALARKVIRIREGDVYSPITMDRSQDDLRLLGLFRRIRLDARETGPRALELRADLAARKPRSVEFGVGYWTDILFTAHARWEHRNLFRGGRGADAKVSYSRVLQTAGTSLWWPALFGSRTRGVIAAGIERQREESYNLFSTDLEFGARYQPSLLSTIRAGVKISDVNLDIKTAETGAFIESGGLLTIFSLGWNRDSSNDRIYPTRGGVTWARVEWTVPGILTESDFALMETGAAGYVALAGRTVLAGRLGMGVAAPTGESVDLLPNKRFYAGGATSMRGFKRRKLGPLDADGAPLGGEAKAEASTELRFPVFWRFRGAVFVDAAQVWSRREQVTWDGVEVAVGPGLMVLTPVGPVRADAGFRITDLEPREPDWVLHVTIGHPY